MRLISSLILLVTLSACGQASTAMPSAPSSSVEASGWGGKSRLPVVAAAATPISIARTDSEFVKDPAIADEGRPIAGKRWMTFGDLRRLYLKGFTVQSGLLRQPKLSFDTSEILIDLKGLPANFDSVWAPEIVVIRNQVVLLYCAGEMPPPHGPRWRTFRLRQAVVSVSDFARQVAAGGNVAFTDQGEILTDLGPYADGNFGVIDPQLYVNPQGRAFMTYTVVTPPTHGRGHEEFVRYREVDPLNPARGLGPDSPMYDGFARTEDDGVAEAQDVITLKGKTYAFISSRPGDLDQKILLAELPHTLGRIDRKTVKPFLVPGGDAWRSDAVGSSGAAVIDGVPFMVFQGMDAKHRFTLGWTTLKI